MDVIPYRPTTEWQKEETHSDMCFVLKWTLLKWTPLKNELFPVQLYFRRRSSSGRTKELGYRLSVFSDWHSMIDPLLFWCFEHVEYIEKVIPMSLCFYDAVTEKIFHCLSRNDLSDREWTRISLSETIYICYKYKMLNFLKLRKGQTFSNLVMHISHLLPTTSCSSCIPDTHFLKS